MTHTIEITNTTHKMLNSYFEHERNNNYRIRRLFDIALSNVLGLARRDIEPEEGMANIKVTNITYNRLMNYFPKERNIDDRIRRLFDLVLNGKRNLKPKTGAHLNNGDWDSP